MSTTRRRQLRVLFLTNFYLANRSGGEDQSCQRVVKGLEERGHTVLVLTSMYGTGNRPVEAAGIHRTLYLEMDLVPWRHSVTFFTQRQARERHNLQRLGQVLDRFTPDIIFIWGMWNLPRSLPALAEAKHPDKVVYRFATYWPTLPSQHELYWRASGRHWYTRLAKQLLGSVARATLARENHRPPLQFRHAICVSAATRDRLVEAGLPVANARVIHTGVDADLYVNAEPDHQARPPNQGLRLLYAGRLVAEKGVDTAIRALEKVVKTHSQRGVQLTVAGSESADYERYLQQMVREAGLTDHVTFLGHVSAEDMPRLLKTFDVLLVPSRWPEPYSRMVLEGMISGLVVVASSTGGTTEILVDGENGLLFPPGDADELARLILRLAKEPELRDRLAQAGQATVLAQCTEAKMMDEIETYLLEVAGPRAA